MDHLILIVALGAVTAGFVQGLAGFGFALVSMSLWAWTIEPRLAAALAVFGSLIGQIIAAITVRRGFRPAVLAPYLIGGLLGIPIGMAVQPLLDVRTFKTVLGAFLVLWCPGMLLARRLPPIRIGGRAADGVAGLLGGMLGGLGGFSGPVPTLWCTLRQMEKDTQRGIIQSFNLVMLGCTMAAYVATGQIHRGMLPLFAIIVAAMLVPVLLGARIYLGISETRFRGIVLTLLTCSGIGMLGSALAAMR